MDIDMKTGGSSIRSVHHLAGLMILVVLGITPGCANVPEAEPKKDAAMTQAEPAPSMASAPAEEEAPPSVQETNVAIARL